VLQDERSTTMMYASPTKTLEPNDDTAGTRIVTR
jgi:hypothetical protein